MITRQNMPDFSNIARNNPSGWILRSNLTKETSGLINSRTAANEDAQGIGIEGRIIVGKRKIAYPVESVIKRLQEKCRFILEKNENGHHGTNKSPLTPGSNQRAIKKEFTPQCKDRISHLLL